MTEVACEALKCDRGRVCSSVTERLREYQGKEAVGLYQSDRVQV